MYVNSPLFTGKLHGRSPTANGSLHTSPLFGCCVGHTRVATTPASGALVTDAPETVCPLLVVVVLAVVFVEDVLEAHPETIAMVAVNRIARFIEAMIARDHTAENHRSVSNR